MQEMLGGSGLGQLACLAAAAVWAVSVTLFRRPIGEFGAPAVNLGKTAIAATLLGLTTLATGQLESFGGASGTALALVALSGFIGMTIGDTALFAAVARAGVHRTLLLQTFSPVFAALASYGIYGERLTGRQWLGGGVVLIGVVLVVAADRSGADGAARSGSSSDRRAGHRVASGSAVAGAGLGLIAAAGQGSGVVLAKAGMEELPVLAASFLRLAVACSALVVLHAVARRLGPLFDGVLTPRGLRRIALPAVLGTYVAILLMMAGIALAPAAIAAVLLATTPVFSLFIDARVQRKPVTPGALVGTVLAVFGVAILSGLGR